MKETKDLKTGKVPKKAAIVTGASSGIGYAVCRQLAEKGYMVFGFSRRGTVPDGAIGVSVDITDRETVFAEVRKAACIAGGIDLLVNNAGMGISGPVEYAREEDIRRIMDVDLNGQVYCTQAVLEIMRTQGHGTIVFVSSVAADIAIPYQAFYSAGKAAVSAVALALRNELKDYNIRVCTILPGDTATGFTDSRQKENMHDDVYPHNTSATKAMEKDERGGMSPEFVASEIIKAALKKNPKPLYTVGTRYKLFLVLFRLLPARLSYYIVGKMYS